MKVLTYRNRKLLDLASQAPECFHCRAPNHGQVVGAHANSQAMGKGGSHKAADIPAYLCQSCHDAYDGRSRGPIQHNDHEAWAWAAVKSLRWALETHPEVFR